MVWATLASLSCGCGGPTIKTTTKLPPQVRPVVRDATRDELLDKYNEIARAVKSVNATVEQFVARGVANDGPYLDRKSTRLNSSHQIISYARFSLKKTTRHT